MARRKSSTPTVATIKAQVRARDNHVCTKCGMTRSLHVERYGRDLEVHRLIPGSRYTLDGSVTLCRTCHGPQPRRGKGQRGAEVLGFNDAMTNRIDRTATGLGLSQMALIRMIVHQNLLRYERQASRLLED